MTDDSIPARRRARRLLTRLLPVGVFVVLVTAALAPFSDQLLAALPADARPLAIVPVDEPLDAAADAPGPLRPLPSVEVGAPPPAPTGPWPGLGANRADAAAVTEPEPGLGGPSWASIGAPCAADDPYRGPHCHELGTASGDAPERSVYLLGNSHTALLAAALLEAVDRNGDWALRSQASPGCPFDHVAEPADDCQRMWSTGTRYILEQQPDLVVIMATRSHRDGAEHENLLPGLADWVATITAETTSRVVVLRDSPRFDFDMHRCAREHGPSSPTCAVADPTLQLPDHRLELEAAGAAYIDLNGAICPGGVCRPVIGGVWTYIDDNHLSADFWRTLAGPLSAHLNARVDWWPANPYLGEPVPRPTGDPVAVV